MDNMKYVTLKTKQGSYKVLFTGDMQYFRGIDMVNALGKNKFLYSITKVMKSLGKDITMESKTPQGNRIYQFISVKGFLEFEDILPKLDREEDRTLKDSMKGAFNKTKELLIESGVISGNGNREPIEPKVNSIDIIMEELVKLSQEIDNKPNMTQLQSMSKELQDTKAELMVTKEQLEISKRKFEELRSANLTLVSRAEKLQKENAELAILKSTLSKLFKGGE